MSSERRRNAGKGPIAINVARKSKSGNRGSPKVQLNTQSRAHVEFPAQSAFLEEVLRQWLRWSLKAVTQTFSKIKLLGPVRRPLPRAGKTLQTVDANQRTVEYIGKEANRWEEQFFLGEVPEAHIEYGSCPAAKRSILKVIKSSTEVRENRAFRPWAAFTSAVDNVDWKAGKSSSSNNHQADACSGGVEFGSHNKKALNRKRVTAHSPGYGVISCCFSGTHQRISKNFGNVGVLQKLV